MRSRIFISAAVTVLWAFAPEAAAQAAPGTYRLAQVGETALPAAVERDGECVEELISATLTLNADGTWLLAGEVRETCGNNVETETEQEDGRYEVTGSEIRFGALDDEEDDEEEEEDLDWEDLALGTTQGDALLVALEEGDTTLLFRR